MADKKLVLTLQVNDDGTMALKRFQDGIDKASKSAEGMSRSLTLIKWDSIVNLTSRVFNATRSFYEFGKEISNSLGAIERQSKILGMSTEEFQRLTYAAQMTDVETGDLMVAMKNLSRNIAETAQGSGAAKSIFDRMGISIHDSTGKTKSLGQMILDLAGKFRMIPDGAQKIALSMELFGRSGERMVSMLNEGKAGLTEFMQKAVVVSDRLIKAGSEAEEAWKAVDREFFAMKANLAPVAADFIGLINNMLIALKEFKEESRGMGGIWESLARQTDVFGQWGLKEGAGEWPKPERKYMDVTGAKREPSLFTENQLRITATPGFGQTVDVPVPFSLSPDFRIDQVGFNDRMEEIMVDTEGAIIDYVGDKPPLQIPWEIAPDFKSQIITLRQGTDDIDKFWNSKITEMGNVFSSGFENVLTHGFENIGDAFKDLANMMLGELTKIFGQLLINEALWGSMTGKPKEGFGTGAFSWLSAFIPKFDSGAIVSHPMIGALAMNNRPEAIIPLDQIGKSGRGGPNVTINNFNIQTYDGRSTEDWIKRNIQTFVAHTKNYNRNAGARGNMV